MARSRDKRGLWLAQLALATLALLLTPLGMEAEPRHEHDGDATPSVGAGEATPLPELDCVIEPDTTVAVGSRVQGVLDTVYVERGDRVVAGQTLAELDSEIEAANVALARARADMDAELQAKEANLGLGERRVARNERLFESRAISFEAKDEGETNAQLAAFELAQARQSRTVAELELARAAVTLDQRRIVSPIDGIVVERAMAPGELVTDQAILHLARVDPLRVEVIVPAEHYGRIARGMRAEILPEAPLDGSHAAKVSIVDAVIDAASGTFGVRLELPNPDHAIPAGLGCRVRFQ